MDRGNAVVTLQTADRGPGSLAELAYVALRDALIMLDIRPGEPIDDDQIARDLGFGRTPVREALKRLQAERLVLTYPRRGTFAAEVNLTDLSHISDVRRQLEPAAAETAAIRATNADRDLLQQLCARLRENAADATTRDLMKLDLESHRALYAATHNPYFQDTLLQYGNLATRIWCLVEDRLPDLAGHVEEHGLLFDAVLRRDSATARTLALSHVVRFESAIRSVL